MLIRLSWLIVFYLHYLCFWSTFWSTNERRILKYVNIIADFPVLSVLSVFALCVLKCYY